MVLEKGITCSNLFQSDIFQYEFDYDEWPSQHTDQRRLLRPYNGSIFDIRKNYKTVFPEEELQAIEKDDDISEDVDRNGRPMSPTSRAKKEKGPKVDTSKIYKIIYRVNLIPYVGEHVIEVDDKSELRNSETSMADLFS